MTSAVSRSGSVLHAAHIDAVARELFTDEAAHVIGADAGDQASLQPKARRADGGVGRAAADILGEAAHILETAAGLAGRRDRSTTSRS